VSGPDFAFRSPPLFDEDDFVSSAAQVRLPLYAGGQITAGIAAARSSRIAAEEMEQSSRAALKLDVARAYVGVLRARRALEAAESSVASLAAHVADVEQMVERELVPRSDLLAARVALANAQHARVRAANDVQIAYAAYNRRLGEPLDRNTDLDQRIPTDPFLAKQPVEALIERALASRSEVHGMAAQAEALAFQADAQLAALRPRVELTGGYNYFENEILDREDFSMVGIGVTWSLFDGGQARNRAAALRHAARAARLRLNDMRSMIELEVRQAWLDVQAAQARIDASREAVAQAEENLRTARELYGADLGTNTQVLEAVSLRTSAVTNRDNAMLDEALAQLQLARAVGAL
jgi:outer membrane protein TolC